MTLLLITIIVTLIFWINHTWIVDFVTHILLNIQESLAFDSLDIQGNLLTFQIKQEYQMRLKNLISASQLFYFVQYQKSNIKLSDLLIIPTPLNTEHLNLSYKNFPYFFSAQFNQEDVSQIPQDQESKDIVNFAKILNHILFAFPNCVSKNTLYYSSILDHQMFGANPTVNYTMSYRPHDRDWYKGHFKYIEENPEQFYSISDPFFLYSQKGFVITMGSTLSNINGSIEGIYGTDFSLFRLDLFQAFRFINIILVDLTGKIINTKLDQNIWNQTIYFYDNSYIYQSEIIGFNEEDWQQIQYQTYYNNGTSNCQLSNRQNYSEHICRSISSLQSNIYIYSYLLDNKYFYINLISISFLKDTQEQIEKVRNSILYSVMETMLICISIGTFIIIICQLYMHLFIKPFEKINQLLKFKLLPNSRQEKRQLSANLSIFNKLGIEKFYQKILNSGKNKSTECKIQESFKYPKNIIKKENMEFQKLNISFTKLVNVTKFFYYLLVRQLEC